MCICNYKKQPTIEYSTFQYIYLRIQPISFRQLKFQFHRFYPILEWMVPQFLYLPWWMVAIGTHRTSFSNLMLHIEMVLYANITDLKIKSG